MFTELVQQHFFFFPLSCHTDAWQRQINAFLSYDANCNEIITPAKTAVFSRNTSVDSHGGFSILIQMALWQDLPAHLFFKVFPGYWSYYAAQWVVYLFFMEAVTVLRTGHLFSDQTGTIRRASRLPSAPTWLGGTSCGGSNHSISTDT